MRRREFIALLFGATVVGPVAARSQQPIASARLVGELMNSAEGDPEVQARLAAFTDGQQLGWTHGRNLRLETHWAVDASRNRQAEELIAQVPEVVSDSSCANVVPLQRITLNVPIVFANVIDPVGAGFVASLAQPGGNTTGFSAI
jgi:putative tryptophan/tyrosine transport system substrate-binding protein